MNRQFDWKNIKKTDWLILGLIGAILLVIMLPDGNGTGNTDNFLWGKESASAGRATMTTGAGTATGVAADTTGQDGAEAYLSHIHRLLVV